MTTVAELVQWLEDFTPSRLAEPWDNVGLLWGDPAAGVGRLMTCLTVTRITAEEAVAEQAGLIVSHHPVLFRAVKRI
ncbi:MAG: Nif3-like dinuclear metal center hexameric protein, partial [Isosphaeraceae bacterium]